MGKNANVTCLQQNVDFGRGVLGELAEDHPNPLISMVSLMQTALQVAQQIFL